MVNPGPSMRQLRLQECKKRNRSNKRSHPADIREGVASAVMLVKEVSVNRILSINFLKVNCNTSTSKIVANNIRFYFFH